MRSKAAPKAVKPKPSAALRSLPIELVDPPPKNTRSDSKEAEFLGLVESIRQYGVIQPVLVRETKTSKGTRYQIIAGERRYLAAKQAKLKEIPAQVMNLDDDAALGAQIVENLQRQDIHPLDEADGLLRLKDTFKLDVAEVARRVGKSPGYVARRLALTTLIAEAREDFRTNLITLGHALEICRLSPEIQKEALAACFEQKYSWNEHDQNDSYEPDKEEPVKHVRHLQTWLTQHVHLNLRSAPFKLDDARLHQDGLTCLDCPERTGHNPALFPDIKNNDTCLNPACFQSKIKTLLDLKKAELAEKNGKPAALISPVYTVSKFQGDTLGRGEYQILPKRADRCEFAEQAVYANGDEIGQVRWICRDKDCTDHLGKVRHDHSGDGVTPTASPDNRHKRLQELFDLKVDEATRKRVMIEALKTYTWPLDRADLNEIAMEFFTRIVHGDQQTIFEVLGWADGDNRRLTSDSQAMLERIALLDDDQLAQFLRLCSFAHYGVNPSMHKPVDQTPVVQLAEARIVNHKLIDAQVRVELSAKKYKADHQTYLDLVAKGEQAQRPVVYEALKPPTLQPEQ